MTSLACGYTTGACAAAGAKVAALLLCRAERASRIDIPLPDGSRLDVPIFDVAPSPNGATARVRKDGGDDPDITTGMLVETSVALATNDGPVRFFAGPGVGTVTLPGLSVAVGEPAINPGPRRMIEAALRELTSLATDVTVSIPGGDIAAERTFNPRLGIVGGLSILGTTGRVRPFSNEAMREALRCSLDVALASGFDAPVYVPGNIGARAARTHLRVDARAIVEVSNDWGAMIDYARSRNVARLLAVGHPGKLAKLAMNAWDTHSAVSQSAVPHVRALAASLGLSFADAPTIEGIFQSLPPIERRELADVLAATVADALRARLHGDSSVILIDMTASILGHAGDLDTWL